MAFSVITNDFSQLPKEFFKKSHELVFSQLDMSSVEQDLFGLFLCRLAEDDWRAFLNSETLEVSSVPEYKFSNQVLSEWMGVSKRDLYKVISKPAKRLSDCSVGIRDDLSQSFRFNPLFSEIRYSKGVLTITPNYKLFKEFLCFSQGHSQIPHKEFRKLRSEYSKRIFAMLCRFKKDGTIFHPIPINELHAYLGLLNQYGNLTKKTYGKINNIIEKIIKPAIAEINSVVSNITFTEDHNDPSRLGFSTVYEKRRIVAIEFNFKWSDKLKSSFKKTIEDAVLTHMQLENGKTEFTQDEIDNLRAFWMDLMIDGFNTSQDIIMKLKSVKIKN